MALEDEPTGDEPIHAASATDHVLMELQLYGWRPFQDEPDPRPVPEGDRVAAAVADIFDALVATLGDTRLEPDLEELLWGAVNLFHRATERIERTLDDNEQDQRRLQREQDGSGGDALDQHAFTRRWRSADRRPARPSCQSGAGASRTTQARGPARRHRSRATARR